METLSARRKLTVILAADFAGYTRLMHADEETTLGILRTYREIIDSMIARHWGRVFNTAGDSVVAEFGSAVEAVRCSIAIQEELASRNVELPDAQQMRLRIGVNLGDVMIEGDNLLGDGVNVAARLESIAEPGGINISEDVYHQVRHKLSVGFEDMGPQRVKNIAERVSVYRVVPGAVSLSRGSRVLKPVTWPRWRIPVLLTIGIVVVSAGAMALWQTMIQPVRAPQRVSDQLSIAVLPFNNLTGDKSQDFLGDGVSEAIITRLAGFSGVSVAARNSTFSYKGEPIKAQQIGKQLGVAYVLEGSLQRSDHQVRTTVQLIEVATGTPIWGRSYDNELKDSLAIQDDLVPGITAQMLMVLGKPREALTVVRRAIRSRPDDRLELMPILSAAYYYLQEYDDAISTSQQFLARRPKTMPVRVILAASFVGAGQHEAAEAEVVKIMREVGGPRYLTAKSPVTRGVFAAFKDPEFKARLHQHLLQAGLPE